ncbi:MAG TPA: hypothetical protein VGC61_04165 [Pyrinomonadaceae bacterium]
MSLARPFKGRGRQSSFPRRVATPETGVGSIVADATRTNFNLIPGVETPG